MKLIFAALLVVLGLSSTHVMAMTIPEKMMQDLQVDLQLSEVQAAGIVGNLAQETGNFRLMKEGGGSGIGYSQWNGSRKKEFKSFAEGHGGIMTYEANYRFILKELNRDYPGLIKKLRQSQTVDESARLFMNVFLRPSKAHAALGKRISYAKTYLQENFAGAGCAAPAVAEGTSRINACPDTLVADADLRPKKRPTFFASLLGRNEVALSSEPIVRPKKRQPVSYRVASK